jgi:hypothetical protein
MKGNKVKKRGAKVVGADTLPAIQARCTEDASSSTGVAAAKCRGNGPTHSNGGNSTVNGTSSTTPTEPEPFRLPRMHTVW